MVAISRQDLRDFVLQVKMRGIESFGMVLCGSNADHYQVPPYQIFLYFIVHAVRFSFGFSLPSYLSTGKMIPLSTPLSDFLLPGGPARAPRGFRAGRATSARGHGAHGTPRRGQGPQVEVTAEGRISFHPESAPMVRGRKILSNHYIRNGAPSGSANEQTCMRAFPSF